MGYAVITGASRGIGLCYSKALAEQYGYSLLMVSNEEEQLSREAEQIRQTMGVEVRALCIDLRGSDAADKIYSYCIENGITVTVLINNVGMLIFDRMTNVSMDKIECILSLHILTLTRLCRLFVPMMEKEGKGYILNMSSMTAHTALPGIQFYNASKAYIMNLSCALWYELQPTIHIMAMLPGAVDTTLLPFPAKWARIMRKAGIIMPPAKLVNKALRKLFYSKKKTYMPGIWSRLFTVLLRHLPDRLILYFTNKILKRKQTYA